MDEGRSTLAAALRVYGVRVYFEEREALKLRGENWVEVLPVFFAPPRFGRHLRHQKLRDDRVNMR
jgi:hypothetical protein